MSLQKDNSIQITSSDLAKGVADSPLVGIGAMVNLDITSTPGLTRIAYALVKDSGSTIVAAPEYMVYDGNNNDVYVLDEDAQLYSDNGGWATIAGNSGSADNGLAIWKNYIITIGISGSDQNLNAYGLSGAPTSGWTLDFDSGDPICIGDTAAYSPTLTSQSGDLWVGVDQFLGQLVEVSGQTFDPADTNTFDITSKVFIGVDSYRINNIDDDGRNFIMGTENVDSNTGGDILLWDPEKAGTAVAFADARIPTGGDNVKQLILKNNIVYAMTGRNAEVIATNQSQVETIKEINKLTTDPDTSFDVRANSVSGFSGGILFGLGKTAGSSADENKAPQIWFLKNGAWSSFTLSTGFWGDNDGGRVYAIVTKDDDEYYVAWADLEGANTYGVDKLSTTTRYQSYEAYFESQFYQVGREYRGKTYKHIGFKLAKPLETDQGIRIKYRDSINDSWTTVGTWDFATYGAIQEYQDHANMLTDLMNVQLRVELTTGSSDTTPELLEVYLN